MAKFTWMIVAATIAGNLNLAAAGSRAVPARMDIWSQYERRSDNRQAGALSKWRDDYVERNTRHPKKRNHELHIPATLEVAIQKRDQTANAMKTSDPINVGSFLTTASTSSASSSPQPASRRGVSLLRPFPDAVAARFAGNKAYLIYRAMKDKRALEGTENQDADTSAKAQSMQTDKSSLTKVKLTYYWVKFQKKGADEGTTELRSCNGKIVFGTSSKKFAEELRMEGTGLLINGKMLNLGDCNCGDGTDTFNCFMDISDDKTAPFGFGVQNIPLKPFVSVANNDMRRRVGSVLYAPDLDGFKLPTGKVHNGCLQKVDQIGRGGKSSHIDFFAVHKNIAMNYFDKKLNKEFIDVQWDAPRCSDKLLDYGVTLNMDFDKIK